MIFQGDFYTLEKDEPIMELCPGCNPAPTLESRYEYNLVHKCTRCGILWIFNLIIPEIPDERMNHYFRNKGILLGQSTREYQKLL